MQRQQLEAAVVEQRGGKVLRFVNDGVVAVCGADEGDDDPEPEPTGHVYLRKLPARILEGSSSLAVPQGGVC